MKAMILAAGLGTRLRPLTESIPKPLLPVGGYPLIAWNLFLLRHHGIIEVVINVHHRGEVIRAELGNGAQWGMRLSYSEEPVLLGTGGGIKQVESFFEGQPFVVMNGDTLVDLDLTAMVLNHQSNTCLATMALRDDPVVEAWGVVETNLMEQVLAINGKGWVSGQPRQSVHRRMFAGIHVIDPLLLRDVPKGENSSIIDAYVACLEKGAHIHGYVFSGYWSDVGNPERYAQVKHDVEAGLLTLPT